MSKSELQDKFVAAEEWFRTMTVKLNEAVNRLSELADQTRESSAGETARAYVQVKNIDGALTDALKALGSVKSRMQYTIVPEKFEQEGCSTYTTDDGFRI